MNNLFSNSFSPFRSEDNREQYQSHHPYHTIQMTSSPSIGGGGVNLDKFFEDVESIKDGLKDIQNIYRKLLDYHEQSKTLHNANAVKGLRTRMDSDVTLALKTAKLIKVCLEAIDRSNDANRILPGCGPGSSSDRIRTSVVNGLRKKLQDSMNSFNALRKQISSEYRETVQRRYFTVTGQNPDEPTLDALISTGESETFLQKAISEQGQGVVSDTVYEIRERHEGVKEMEKNLNELHQVFLDMAQGEQLDDIESHVARARELQKRTRILIIFYLVGMLFAIALMVRFTIYGHL